MKSFRREFYANASLSSQVLCCKHYISMCLDEYRKKLWLKLVMKIPHRIDPSVLALICNFSK